jgi:hypothetical protein
LKAVQKAAFALTCVVLTIAVACTDSPTRPTPHTAEPPHKPQPTPAPGPTRVSAVLVAVADIGLCGSPGVQQTARLVDRIDGQLVLAGDLAYMHGSMQDFLRCFDPWWGHLRRRWRPTPGNHEYETAGAAGYFQYFAEAASVAGRSYYSFRAGDWLVLMLDSNVPARTGSPQYEFVRSELQANTTPCVMAVWHHPLFSSGPNGPSLFMRDMWALLYEQNADVVVNGHDHLYERFGKQDTEGRSDARGLRQFIVGTGGATLYDFQRMAPNSQARVKAHGVLRLTLNTSNYEWAFLDAAGGTADTGFDSCH